MRDSIVVVICEEFAERFVSLCEKLDVKIVSKKDAGFGRIYFVIYAYPLYYWYLGREYQEMINSDNL